jgi:hypothetical protein
LKKNLKKKEKKVVKEEALKILLWLHFSPSLKVLLEKVYFTPRNHHITP